MISYASRDLNRRSLRSLLIPVLERVAQSTAGWRAESAGYWNTPDGRYWLPRMIFSRPHETPPVKIAIFAGIHGDEPAGVHALCDFITSIEAVPTLARQYCIHVYPICNPTGFEDGTRHSRSGRDLNREFWKSTKEPEVCLLEAALRRENYQGIISLHSDDTSDGLYGFVSGSTLTENLLKPALAAAEAMLPVNQNPTIDGFHAINGIIRSAYGGVLAAPPGASPAPFEIILESPALAPLELQRASLLLALTEILRHYRRFIAYAADL